MAESLAAIAEQPNDIPKCAMRLSMDNLDGAPRFARWPTVAEALRPTSRGDAILMKTTATSPTAA